MPANQDASDERVVRSSDAQCVSVAALIDLRVPVFACRSH